MDLTLMPASLTGRLRLIPSKSASHRAVLLSALARGETQLQPLLLSGDISATLSCCSSLGILRQTASGASDFPGAVRMFITGGEIPSPGGRTRVLDCGESGSTLRFLLPLALDGRGPVRFVGHGRLMQRPLDIYRELFTAQGASWVQRGNELTVEGSLTAGIYELPGDVSSQFVTGLLLALPLLGGDSQVVLTTPLESASYVEMTRQIQRRFEVQTFWDPEGRCLSVPGRQRPRSPGLLPLEGDWSHACFYAVAGAISRKGPMRLCGLNPESPQPDRQILGFLQQMGADCRWENGELLVFPSQLCAITADCAQCPDLVPALAVAMTAARGESRITGAGRLRLKESDRLSAICHAINGCGGICRETPDGLIIRGMSLLGGRVEGANDHRIVMAMAMAAALSRKPLTLTDTEAVAKSAPGFWKEYAALGGEIQ